MSGFSFSRLATAGQPDLNFIVGIVLGEFVEWPRVDKESCRRVTASMPVPSKRRCRGSLLLSVMETQKSTMSPLLLTSDNPVSQNQLLNNFSFNIFH